jgi:hypothetical protein
MKTIDATFRFQVEGYKDLFLVRVEQIDPNTHGTPQYRFTVSHGLKPSKAWRQDGVRGNQPFGASNAKGSLGRYIKLGKEEGWL